MDWITPFLQTAVTWFLTVLVTAVQIFCWPINELVNTAFPSVGDYITNAVTYLSSYLAFFPWLLSFLPAGTGGLLLFILGVELVLLYVFQSSYYVAKLWKIVQTVKFW